MRISLSILLVLIVITASAQNFNFGLIGGINEELWQSERTVRHDYFELVVESPRVNNQHIALGVFAEYAIPKLNRISVTSNLTGWTRAVRVMVYDYHPDILMIPLSGPTHISYQTWAWSVQPTVRIFKFFNASAGYELHYNHRTTEYGWDWQNEVGPNQHWINVRMFEMMHSARFMDVDKFIHNVYVAVELRYWHIGLEYRTGYALGKNLVSEVVHNGNVFNTNYRLENHFLRLKVYFNNVGEFRFVK